MTKILEKTIIDLTDSASSADALNKFELALQSKEYLNKAVSVVLGKLVFTHGHMARLKTLATQNNVDIEIVYSSAVQTQLAGLNTGLLVAERAPGEKFLEDFKNSLKSATSET